MSEERTGVEILKAFFGAFLDVSADYMGLASNSMLYRAGEMVGESFSFLSPDELTNAFSDMGMTVMVQQNSSQWIFVVENSVECTMCGGAKFEPHCHMLRGFFSSYVRARSRNPYLRCIETECASSGGDFCRFVVSP